MYQSVFDTSRSTHPHLSTTTPSHQRSTSAAADAINIAGLCSMSFRLVIGQGLLTLFAPVRDSLARVIPGQMGEFAIKLGATDLFSVSGYNGNADLGYVCLQSATVELYHAGLSAVPSTTPPLRKIGSLLPNHMLATLYATPRNLSPLSLASGAKTVRGREQLSMAVEIQKRTQQRVKRIKLALGVEQTTLRYNAAISEHSWLMQMIDLFDVTVSTMVRFDWMAFEITDCDAARTGRHCGGLLAARCDHRNAFTHVGLRCRLSVRPTITGQQLSTLIETLPLYQTHPSRLSRCGDARLARTGHQSVHRQLRMYAALHR